MSSIDIYAILASKPHNAHYLKRYWKFIQNCIDSNTTLSESVYKEKHHICPKAKDLFPEFSCLTKNAWNSLQLTANQHIIAHMILWKAYGGSQTAALEFMINKSGILKNDNFFIGKQSRSLIIELRQESFRYNQKRNSNLLESGQHIFQSTEHRNKISAMQRRRIEAGDHPFAEAEHGARTSALQKKRIADGTFHMLQPEYRESQRQKALDDVAAGTHNFIEVKTCPVCGKTGKGPMMHKWHFDNCGKKFVYYTDGRQSFRIPEDATPDPAWTRGMAPKR